MRSARTVLVASLVVLALFSTLVSAQRLSVATDRERYVPGDTVIVYGAAWPGANVSLVVEGPGGILWERNVTANSQGLFAESFFLPDGAVPGRYVVRAVADNETATSEFEVAALPTLSGKCVLVYPPNVTAYPGQSVEVKALVRNEGTSNGTFCLRVSSEHLGESEACTLLAPGEETSLRLTLRVPLDTPPGNYTVGLTYTAYWPNGSVAEEGACGAFTLSVPPTNVDVTIVFRLPSGELLAGAAVYLCGSLAGFTDSNGSLKLRLVANKKYRVAVEKEIDGLRLRHEEELWVRLLEEQVFNITVVPREPCRISTVVPEPSKIERGGHLDVAVRYIVVPTAPNSSYELLIKPEWSERELRLSAGRTSRILVGTASYSLRAPDSPGIYTIEAVLVVGGSSCKASTELEVWRRREGCVRVLALYPDGTPARNATVRVGGRVSYTDAQGVATVCGLKEGFYTVSVVDRLNVYRREVSEVEVRAFETTEITVYLEPSTPCVELARGEVYRASFSRYTNWSLVVPLRIRRCRFALPLTLVVRLRDAPWVNATITVARPKYDAELPLEFILPAELTAELSPGSSYRVDLLVLDSEGAEVASFEVYKLYVKDDIAKILASPAIATKPYDLLLYVLTAADISLAILLALVHGGGKDVPVLRTVVKAAAKAGTSEKAALTVVAAAIYAYIAYTVVNTVVNTSWFGAFLEVRPLNIVVLGASLVGLAACLRKAASSALRKLHEQAEKLLALVERRLKREGRKSEKNKNGQCRA